MRLFPNAGSRKWQISTDGGAGPVWTRGGREIVYLGSQGRMMAVAVRSDANEPDFSKPEPLFKSHLLKTLTGSCPGMSLRTASVSCFS